MYDDVAINLDLLPITAEQKSGLREYSFQSKQFDCAADELEIVENRLFRNGKDMNFHGIFNFYTLSENHEWFEFNATFAYGNLIEIVQVFEEK